VTERILQVVQPAADPVACCAACAAPAPDAATGTPQPAVGHPAASGSVRDARRPVPRADDRRITFAGLLVSAGLLGLAMASVALPDGVRRGLWAPLHLGLAGAAGTAVASVLPFFTTALAVAAPAGRSLRLAAIASIALGSLSVTGGVIAAMPPLAVAGGVTYLGGLVLVALAAFGTLRGALGPRRLLLRAAYVAALVQVATGVVAATAMLSGFAPVVEGWGLLKPAHGWLNVFGFLSLTVAATLVHLAPTVAGSRIRARRSSTIAVVCLASGAPLVAIGFSLDADLVARGGALTELVGAAALVVHALSVGSGEARWTTDPGWHRMTSWSLVAAPAWLLVAVAIAGSRILSMGADPGAWSIGELAAPLAVGWMAQVLIGAWSHLLPAIGPGDRFAHDRARSVLGWAATARVLLFNLGVALLVVSGPSGWSVPIALGVAMTLGTGVVALVTFIVAGAAALTGTQRSPGPRTRPIDAAPSRPADA
jgi:hypothetical protein